MSPKKLDAPKTSICVSVDSALIEKARKFEISLSKAAADGIERAVKRQEKIRELLGDDE